MTTIRIEDLPEDGAELSMNPSMLYFVTGLSSMLYFAGPKAAIRFGAFEFFNGLLSDEKGGDKYGLGSGKGFLAGLGAGALEAVFVTVSALLSPHMISFSTSNID